MNKSYKGLPSICILASQKTKEKKMIAIFIAPFYIALNIYLFWRIKGWVQAYFPKLKGKKGWIVPIVLYAFWRRRW